MVILNDLDLVVNALVLPHQVHKPLVLYLQFQLQLIDRLVLKSLVLVVFLLVSNQVAIHEVLFGVKWFVIIVEPELVSGRRRR